MRRANSGRGRLIIAVVIAVISIVSYCSTREYNPITDETQYVDLSPDQEIAMGLQAAPEIAAQFGGLSPDQEAQALVDEIGRELVAKTAASDTPYQFEFSVLDDDQTINAFALPGGPIFITEALLRQLRTRGEIAGVLGHEIGHVVARHASEHIAKAKLTEGLTGAAVIAAYDPENPSSQQQAAMAALVGQLINMRFGREDEIESDRLGVRFISEAGYDPRSLIRVMEVLSQANQGQAPPEFFSTHPNPDRRIERIQEAIAERFPDGVPEGLIE